MPEVCKSSGDNCEMFAAVVSGVVLGAEWLAVALGLSLIYGVMRVINFAHGSVLMVGLFLCYFSYEILGLDPYLAVLIVCPLMFVFGYVLQRVLITPLIKREPSSVIAPMTVIILTAGLWLILDNGAFLAVGGKYRALDSFLTGTTLSWGGAVVSAERMVMVMVSIAMAYGLYLFLKKTDLGRAITATAQNRDAAAISGINIYRLYQMSFGIACIIIGIAACLILPFHYVTPFAGWPFDIRCFIIVILGGMGSIPGVVVASLLYGLVIAVGTQFIPLELVDILFLVIFVLVLVLRPQGLLGKEIELAR